MRSPIGRSKVSLHDGWRGFACAEMTLARICLCRDDAGADLPVQSLPKCNPCHIKTYSINNDINCINENVDVEDKVSVYLFDLLKFFKTFKSQPKPLD